jgi:hypothetical protein
VHRPVVAPELGEFPRPVERIDDPDALRAQSHRVVGALLGQHRVVGPLVGERFDQKVVRALVPRGFPLARVGIGEFLPNLQQQPPRLGGQPRGQRVVIHRWLHGPSQSSICW